MKQKKSVRRPKRRFYLFRAYVMDLTADQQKQIQNIFVDAGFQVQVNDRRMLANEIDNRYTEQEIEDKLAKMGEERYIIQNI
jgi:hypothetical protein